MACTLVFADRVPSGALLPYGELGLCQLWPYRGHCWEVRTGAKKAADGEVLQDRKVNSLLPIHSTTAVEGG